MRDGSRRIPEVLEQNDVAGPMNQDRPARDPGEALDESSACGEGLGTIRRGFGTRSLKAITPTMIEQYRDFIRTEPGLQGTTLKPAQLTGFLKDLYKDRYLYEPHVFLVRGQSVQSIKTAFRAACRRTGITGFRFYDLRHPAVTNMRRTGIDYLTIMRITGHKTFAVFTRYNSSLEGDLWEASRRFNTYFTRAHLPTSAVSHKSAKDQALRP